MPDHVRLYQPARVVFYGPRDRDRLQKQLELDMKYTAVGQPTDRGDLQLNPRTGATRNGFRYTSIAFMRLCRAACPGLRRVVTNLAGDARPQDYAGEAISVPAACSTFNLVVDVRYTGVLAQHQLVTDLRTRRIEGLLGPSSHHLSNLEFLDLAESVCKGYEASFHGAELIGRLLRSHFIIPGVIRVGPDLFRTGYTFISDEGGDAALQSYRFYLHKDGGRVLEPTRQRRQKRAGGKFIERLKRLLNSAFTDQHMTMQPVLGRLKINRLFRAKSERGVQIGAALWVKRLRAAGMPADLAESAIAKCRGLGPDTAAPLSLEEELEVTEYDLFKRVLAMTRTKNISVRDSVGEAAFKEFFQIGEDR